MMTHLSTNNGIRTISLVVFSVLLAPVAGFGGKKAGEVLVTTESGPNGSDAQRGSSKNGEGIQERVRKDGLKAASLLREAVCGGAPVSSWAAVYLRRLGIAHDRDCAYRALVDGVGAADPLLQALCWRHLAGDKQIPLPKWHPKSDRDPAVEALAAIAYAVRGNVPKSLKFALTVPAGRPAGKSRKSAVEKRAGHLGALGLAFDDGPVALATAFVEARDQECVIGTGKQRRFAAEALRDSLINAITGARASVSAKLPKQGAAARGSGVVAGRLDNHLVGRPIDTIRAIVLTGEVSLRQAGLRALAVVAKEPAAGDLAAAASALVSRDPALRIEGARTYLLLLRRASENP